MQKIKTAAFLLSFALLVVFTYQNWVNPEPKIQFLTFTLPPLPYSLVIFGSFLFGFVAGWLFHALRLKRSKDTFS
jgi:uncharacterized integral membrane protein